MGPQKHPSLPRALSLVVENQRRDGHRSLFPWPPSRGAPITGSGPSFSSWFKNHVGKVATNVQQRLGLGGNSGEGSLA